MVAVRSQQKEVGFIFRGQLHQDIANSSTQRECHFGLVDYNGTPKPALAAYRNAIP